MLVLEPLWVYGSVGLCVAAARRQLSTVPDIWGNGYFSAILIMIATVFVPVENWVLMRHTDWETSFMYPDPAHSSLIPYAPVLHTSVTLISYRLSMFLLQNYGVDSVIKSTMWAFSLFFASQGVFYDTLMYAGTYQEYHSGVEKTFQEFFYTDRFWDAYVLFFLLFGPVFYYLVIRWSSGYTPAQKSGFIWKLCREVAQHCALIYGLYAGVVVSGLAPPRYGWERLGIVVLMHAGPHLLVILPLFLATTKDRVE